MAGAATAARGCAYVGLRRLLTLTRAATQDGRGGRGRGEEVGRSQWRATGSGVLRHGRCSWMTPTQCGLVLGHRRSGVVGDGGAGSSGPPSVRPPVGRHVDVLPRPSPTCRTFIRKRGDWRTARRTTRRTSAMARGRGLMGQGDRGAWTGRLGQPSMPRRKPVKSVICPAVLGHMTDRSRPDGLPSLCWACGAPPYDRLFGHMTEARRPAMCIRPTSRSYDRTVTGI